MAWSLILVGSGSSVIKSGEKIFAKLAYSFRTTMEASVVFKETIWIWWEEWILKLELVRPAMCTTKILSSESRVVAAISFFLTSSTCQVVEKALIVVYNLYLSSRSVKLTSTLQKVRKRISEATLMLISANRKVSSKKQDLLLLSSNKKKAITISKISSLLLLIV